MTGIFNRTCHFILYIVYLCLFRCVKFVLNYHSTSEVDDTIGIDEEEDDGFSDTFGGEDGPTPRASSSSTALAAAGTGKGKKRG